MKCCRIFVFCLAQELRDPVANLLDIFEFLSQADHRILYVTFSVPKILGTRC